MKAIIFDSSALISLGMNGLFNEIKKLKEIFDGKFLITESVKYEIIDRPIKIRRFQLEAMRLNQLLKEKVLELPDSIGVKKNEIQIKTKELLEIANNSFEANGRNIEIVHEGEISAFALSSILNKQGIKNVIAIDERTGRLLVEKPENLKDIFKKKLHTSVKIKRKNFSIFNGFRIIRSSELLYVLWRKGLINIKDKNLLEALLYAVKFKGCSINEEEIKEIKKLQSVS